MHGDSPMMAVERLNQLLVWEQRNAVKELQERVREPSPKGEGFVSQFRLSDKVVKN
jgi:hypothetical protein